LGGGVTVTGADRPAENVVLAYACITARREAMGAAPLMVTDRNGNAIESGPLVDLLERPNATQSWDEYVRVLETFLTLYNACAVALVGERGDLPDELVPLSPTGMTAEMGVHIPTATPRVMRWAYQDPTTGYRRTFEPEEVIVRMGYNPHAPLAALSPTKVLTRTIQSDIAARESNLGLFNNNSTPAGYLWTEKPTTKEQATEVSEVWNGAHGGYANRHKTAVLWGGLKYQKIGLTPQELEYVNSLRALRIDYYMVFRVYPAMLAEMTGETGLSQGSSTDAQRVAWWEDVGLPELDLLAGVHQEVANKFGASGRVGRTRSLTRIERAAFDRRRGRSELDVWFNDSAIAALARSRTARVDTLMKLLSQGWKPDDGNEYLDMGLPPHPDNVGRVGFALTPIGEDAEEKPAPAATGEKEDLAEQGQETIRALDRLEELMRAKTDETRGRERETFAKFLAPREKLAREKWSRFFVEQRGRVLKRVESVARVEKDELLAAVFPRAQEDGQLVARMTALWAAHLQDGWDLFRTRTGAGAPFAVEDPRVQEAIARRRIQGLKVNATTEEALRDIFKESFAEGLTVADTADRIAEYYNANCVGADRARPMTAARTQTAGIVNDGQLAAAKAAGGVKKFWIHGDSEEPRESHLAAAREYDAAHAIALEAKFRVGGEDMDAPGDPDADVSNTANCTCFLGFTK
jgi:HK97 family phage portal protein